MQFVNRTNELKTLNTEYNANRSSLVIIYGRRRVGKTRLIKEFIKDKEALVFIATEENEQENRKNFKNTVAKYINSDLLIEISDLSWEGIFKELLKKNSTSKKIIVIDEFQYIGKSNTGFPSLFQKIWDTILIDKNVMIILSGSIISMMKSQALNYSSPLYGRRTAQINVKPIKFLHYKEFYPKGEHNQLIENYALTGGVPKYIESLLEYCTFEEKIRSVLTNPNSYLYEEAYFLLNSEVPEIGNYFSILRAISNGNVKTKDISMILETKIPNLIHYLKVLQDMDIISRETPITEKNSERSKKVLYKIKDNYINFWFKYIYPNRVFIEMDKSSELVKQVLSKVTEEHISYVYEDIAKEYVLAYWDSINNITYQKVGKWWDKHNEIDLIALNDTKKRILFGECKYRRSSVGMKEYMDLVKKSSLVKWNNEDRIEEFALFSKSGFTDELKNFSKNNKQLTLIKGLTCDL